MGRIVITRVNWNFITFSRFFPIKWTVASGLVVGEILFFTLGSSFAFGLWYGLTLALALNGFLVNWTAELVGEEKQGAEGGKVTQKVSLVALARFLIYGLALAFTTLTGWLNFFAAAGGVVIPGFVLRFRVALNNSRSEVKDA